MRLQGRGQAVLCRRRMAAGGPPTAATGGPASAGSAGHAGSTATRREGPELRVRRALQPGTAASEPWAAGTARRRGLWPANWRGCLSISSRRPAARILAAGGVILAPTFCTPHPATGPLLQGHGLSPRIPEVAGAPGAPFLCDKQLAAMRNPEQQDEALRRAVTAHQVMDHNAQIGRASTSGGCTAPPGQLQDHPAQRALNNPRGPLPALRRGQGLDQRRDFGPSGPNAERHQPRRPRGHAGLLSHRAGPTTSARRNHGRTGAGMSLPPPDSSPLTAS